VASSTYDVNLHTHFIRRDDQLLDEPQALLLVVDNRIWFVGCYVNEGGSKGFKAESPYDAVGNCVGSIPVEGAEFLEREEADEISKLIWAEEQAYGANLTDNSEAFMRGDH
jgi:hypothetical protein